MKISNNELVVDFGAGPSSSVNVDKTKQTYACNVDLETCGGKGLNLAIMAGSGLPVPVGFIVTTKGYQMHVKDRVRKVIKDALQAYNDAADDESTLQVVGRQVREAIVNSAMDAAVRTEIENAIQRQFLASPVMSKNGDVLPVAVRSSATAEDLPQFSFAGQHDSYLDIPCDVDAVCDAVRRCWASLWTDRAIAYRARNRVDGESVSLAVVVQAMVPAQAAGVLFTANPINGVRTQNVIDSTHGLGEALVSGEVIPDHFVCDQQGNVLDRQLADDNKGSSISDPEIKALCQLGERVKQTFGGQPQDIEWAVDPDGTVRLLQSRPITTLMPLPDLPKPGSLYDSGDQYPKLFVSFAHHQGLTEPLSPLGIDGMGMVLASLRAFFLRRPAPKSVLTDGYFMAQSGSRGWENVTEVVQTPIFGSMSKLMLSNISKSAPNVVDAYLKEHPAVLKSRSPMDYVNYLFSFGRLLFLLLPKIMKTLWNPDRLSPLKQDLQMRCKTLRYKMADEQHSVFGVMREAIETGIINCFFLPVAMPLLKLASVLAPTAELQEQAQEVLVAAALNNPTVEMNVDLWNIAVRHAEPLAGFSGNLEDVDAVYQASPGLKQDMEQFLGTYGHRGHTEIDCYSERWAERPDLVLGLCSSYAQLHKSQQQQKEEKEKRGPAAAAERAADNAAQWLVQCQAVSSERAAHGSVLTRMLESMRMSVLRFCYSRVIPMFGFREMPKFLLINLIYGLRMRAFSIGERLVKRGVLKQRDDVFFLREFELAPCAALTGDGPDAVRFRGLIDQRKEEYTVERDRKQIPIAMLSNGQVFYNGFGDFTVRRDVDDDGNRLIHGTGVSVGQHTGRVVVLREPDPKAVSEGDILVCAGTDPSWTALFAICGGLVTEVGGFLTHGSVVAREYGIPAVVGVDQCCTELKTGQRIMLDGNTGVITLLTK